MFTSTLFAMAVTIVAPAPKAKVGPVKIDGEWVVEKYISGGKEEPKRAGTHFSIADGKIAVRGDEAVKFAIEPKADPPKIDIDAGKELIQGIWNIKGDTLTICFPKGGKGDRPKAFESPEGSRIILIILKPEKK